MSSVVPFRSPHGTLEGAEREAAMAVAQRAADEVAGEAVCQVVRALSRQPGCALLAVEDVLAVLAPAIQKRLRQFDA